MPAVMVEAKREIALQLTGACFAYDSEPVLSQVDLEVESGRFFGLLGPNGSGKTTLLQLFCGAIRADAGAVKILGREVASWEPRELARLVAVVPQRFDLAFPFTVQEVILLGRVPHRGPLALDRAEDLEVAREAMRAVEVSHLASRRMHELSGGEFKRVVVAKALAQQPRILLLDEPAAHLDIRHQVSLYELIEDIRRRTGCTVVSAMHDLNLAAAYCDRVALLSQKRVARTGSVEAVMTYRNLRDVFGTEIYVGVNELTGHRLFTPMAAKPGAES